MLTTRPLSSTVKPCLGMEAQADVEVDDQCGMEVEKMEAEAGVKVELMAA